MKLKLKSLAIVFTLGFLVLAGLKPVLAQTAESSISQKESLAADISQVRQTYKGQLAEYRQAEDQFVIAKNQYLQLSTLASLETAVVKTQQLMKLRTQVLATYFKLLELELIDSQGIELSLKTELLDDVTTLQADLNSHLEMVEQARTREDVALAVADFEILRPRVVAVSEIARNTLKLADLQNVYDKSRLLLEDLEPEQDDSSLEATQKARAYNEVVGQMELTGQTLDILWQEIITAKSKQTNLNLNREFNNIFSDLSKILNYLQELVTT